MYKKIRVLTILFNSPITLDEIPLFRGAVLASIGRGADVLFHNHRSETEFRYSYPLIQYKRMRGKAAIVCVEQGTDIVGQFLAQAPEMLTLGKRIVPLELMRVMPRRVMVQTWNAMFEYHINRWLPLNSANLPRFMAAEDEQERRALLENILKANLLSMLKGLGIFLECEIQLHITELARPYKIRHKNVGMLAFNARFTCNLSIPDGLGVGKSASVGFGMIRQIRESEE